MVASKTAFNSNFAMYEKRRKFFLLFEQLDDSFRDYTLFEKGYTVDFGHRL